MSAYYANSPEKFPDHEHFAVLVFGTKSIPGDERSRTNPGHGYPSGYETTTEYIYFINDQDLKSWVKEQGEKCKFVVLKVKPLQVQKTISIEIKELDI